MTTTGRDPSRTTDDPPLVTGCGRRVEVHCLRFVAPGHTIGRVALAVGQDQSGEPGMWAALTPDEARLLARLLLDHADTAQHDTGQNDTAPAQGPVPARDQARTPAQAV